jgi:hypothetical protein
VKCKAEIQRAGLRKSVEINPVRVDYLFVGKLFDHLEHEIMMKRDGFLGFILGQPAETDPVTVIRLPEMLVRRLDRSDHEAFGRDRLRLAHHIAFMRSVTVNGEQKRRLRRRVFGNGNVVVKFYFGG